MISGNTVFNSDICYIMFLSNNMVIAHHGNHTSEHPKIQQFH
jgi:hypothetical protein